MITVSYVPSSSSMVEWTHLTLTPAVIPFSRASSKALASTSTPTTCAGLMSPAHVVGVDVDARALELARENGMTAGVKVKWVHSTIDELDGTYDTVIMNPPYGTRTIHADTRFLDKAFQLAPITYSIHKASTRTFLARYVHKSNRRIAEARTMSLKIPHLYTFHTRRWKSIEVDLCRIVT